MRVATVFRNLLGVTKLLVKNVDFAFDGLVVHVRPRWRLPRCSLCSKQAPGYDRKPARKWRHLALGRYSIWLSYAPRRVDCPGCGVRVEEVPWATPQSRFTRDFEEMVAYLAQGTDKTKVAKLMGISWVTVGAIVERIVAARLDPERLEDLRRIGVDEFSYRKRHRYLTIVVDDDRGRVIWAGEGRSAEVLEGFFGGVLRCFNIKEVTIDMAGGYIKAVENWLPQADIIFDRFHVQRLASDAVDEVRRSMVREVEDPEEAKAIKRSSEVASLSEEPLGPHDVSADEIERGAEQKQTPLPRLSSQRDARGHTQLLATEEGRVCLETVAGVGFTFEAETLRQGLTDNTPALRRRRRIRQNAPDQWAGRGTQQQASHGRPARLRFSLRLRLDRDVLSQQRRCPACPSTTRNLPTRTVGDLKESNPHSECHVGQPSRECDPYTNCPRS